MIITIIIMMMMWQKKRGAEAEDIGMHKIYRLKLSQRLEAFKNDMSESRESSPALPWCYHNHYYYYVYFPKPKYADQVQLLMAHNLFIFNLN